MYAVLLCASPGKPVLHKIKITRNGGMYMKKYISLFLTLAMLFGLGGVLNGCSPSPAYRIGIITGSVLQEEEEYLTAEAMQEKYGDMVVTATYPDNFDKEQLLEISTSMAADPTVKAIIWVQAVEGTAEAIRKIRETRDDILCIAGVCSDTPDAIAEAADICLQVDELAMGTTIIDQAYAMGAMTFIHISFDRHLEYSTISARRDLLEENCRRLGITYVKATAPDPIGEAGVESAQAWITENIAAYVEQYGKDTAFFSTNCSLQAPLILQCARLGAIYPQQCCPSPYHGYPDAFGISTAGHEGDVSYILEQISAKVAEYGNSGRMSTWEVPVNSMILEAGFHYAWKWAEGRISARCDEAALTEEIRRLAGNTATISRYYDSTAGELANYFLILCPFYNF